MFDASKWMDQRVKRELDKSWAPIIYEYVYKKIDEEKFRVLYDNVKGRPNTSVRKLITLELIQHLVNVSDDELWQMYLFDYRVSYALGQLALGEEPMSERTRYNFRERLYLHTMNHPDNDLISLQFKELLEEFNKVIKADMSEMRIDTTMFMSNIKKSGRISLAYDVLIRASKIIPENQQSETIKNILTPTFKRDVVSSVKTDEAQSKLTILLRYCQEVLNILENLADVNAVDEIRIIKRLLDEQGVVNEANEIEAKTNDQMEARFMQSAFDEDATYRIKGERKQSGYVGSITETCSDENDVQLITDYHVAPNITPDTDIIDESFDHIENIGCEKLYSDGGFYSSDTVDEAIDHGIEMKYTALTGKPMEGYLSVDDFILSEDKSCILNCPAGVEPLFNKNTEANIIAHFDKKACFQCPLLDKCPMEYLKKTNVVKFSKESIAAALQRYLCVENRTENTSKRAAIEGTISALKRKGCAKLRVRGLTRCTVVFGLKVIAQNIQRLTNLINGHYKTKKLQPT